MQLECLGWDRAWSESLSAVGEKDLRAGRVFSANREQYLLYGEHGEVRAECSGALLFRADEGGLPAVGDWVSYRQYRAGDLAIVDHVLDRRTSFSRRAAGRVATEQVIAANVDAVFIVMGLDGDFNPRRIERYLAAVRQSGAEPVIVLNKTDVCANTEVRSLEINAIAPGTALLRISALLGTGTEELARSLLPARTGVLVGSSGVGKSTIVNALLGKQLQRTQDTREQDGRGRHTTTQRELFLLPQGGLILDTPGMRELQLWADDSGLEESFSDIESLAQACAFRDCRHQHEPRCAVREAVASGEVDPGRWNSYLKLRKELRYREAESDIHLRLAEKQRWKKLCRALKDMQRLK